MALGETKGGETEQADTPAANMLCVECAMCCDGTLFPAAEVSQGDASRLGVIGFDLSAGPNGPTFALPCPMLAGRRCGIYAERPSLCATFRCRLLAKLSAGEIDLKQARTTVARARELQAAATAAQAQALTVAGRTAWRKAAVADNETSAPRDPAALLASITLDWYLDTHFRVKPALATSRSSKPGSAR